MRRILEVLLSVLLIPVLLMWREHERDALFVVRCDDGVFCGRCQKEIDKEESEICWYCIDWLCSECWDLYGHCGHKEADEANERARQVNQP